MGRLLAKPSIPRLPGVWLPSGPSLDLSFLTGYLDPRVTFARAGAATYFDSAGVLQTAAANAPRFDYDPVTLAPKGLLLEESRTNLLLRSNDFTNAAWIKNQASVVQAAALGPDGAMSLTKLVENATNNLHYLRQQASFVAGTVYTTTVYARAGERNVLQLVYTSVAFGSNIAGFFQLSGAGACFARAGGTASILHVGGGLYRCTLTATATVTVSDSAHIRLHADYVDTINGYTGDGVSGLYVGFAQLEVGGFATSHIPTTTAAVTRPADTLDSVEPHFSTWFNRAQGTLAMELSSFGAGKTNGVMFIQRTGAGPRHQITYGTTGVVGAAVVNDSDVVDVGGIGAAGTVVSGAVTKLAYAYANNDFVFTRDNLAVATDLSGSVPLTVNVARFGFANGTPLNGHLRRFRYWNTRKTNTQVRELTV